MILGAEVLTNSGQPDSPSPSSDIASSLVCESLQAY